MKKLKTSTHTAACHSSRGNNDEEDIEVNNDIEEKGYKDKAVDDEYHNIDGNKQERIKEMDLRVINGSKESEVCLVSISVFYFIYLTHTRPMYIF